MPEAAREVPPRPQVGDADHLPPATHCTFLERRAGAQVTVRNQVTMLCCALLQSCTWAPCTRVAGVPTSPFCDSEEV